MHPLYSIPMFVTSALAAGFGVYVFLQAPSKTLHRLFCLLSLSVSWWALGYGAVYCVSDPNTALLLTRCAYIGVSFIPTFFFHFTRSFLRQPAGRAVRLSYALSAIFVATSRTSLVMRSVKLYFWGYYAISGPLGWMFTIFYYTSFICGFYGLLKARQRLPLSPENAHYRSQLETLLWGYGVASLTISDYLPFFGIACYPFAYLAALGWLGFMAYAIFRQRLLDVQGVIQKTIVYSLVTASLTIIYVYFVTLFASMSRGYVRSAALLPSALVALIVAIVFHPLFRAVQSFVDRYFMRGKADRDRRLLELSENLASQDQQEPVLALLSKFVLEAVGARTLDVYLREAEGDSYICVTTPPGEPIQKLTKDQIPAAQALGKPLAILMGPEAAPSGLLLVGEKLSGQRYDTADIDLLRMAANQASLALGKKRLLHEFSEAFMHELKTPLSSISLPAELTLLDMRDLRTGRRSAAAVSEKVETRMRYIMDQALAVGYRLEAVRLLLSAEHRPPEEVPVQDLVAKALASLQPLLHKARATVAIHSHVAEGIVRCDPSQMEIVFVNLIKNAIEAVEAASRPERMIVVTLRETGSMLVISVEDSGVGFVPGSEARIFEPTYSTKEERGRGMGLFLSRQIVVSHSGELTAGQGSLGGAAITVQLPKSAHPKPVIETSSQNGGAI